MGRKNKKWNSKRRNSNNKDKKDQKGEETYVDKSNGKESKYEFRNHPSDFIPDESIRKQVGSFSFNNTIGIPIKFKSTVEGIAALNEQQIPSVMSISLFSSIGAIDTQNYIDGVNTSGHKWYNILSSMNAKTTQYQPEDLSLAEVCISSLIENVANAERVYGVCFNFNPRNRSVPDALVMAMGIDPMSLAYDGDVSAFRMRLNRILTKANGIRFVSDINLFQRSWELNSRIFIDEDSSMGQYYIFRPHGYWLLTEGASEQRATWVDFGNDLMAAGDYLDHIDQMVSTLLQSSLFNYIYTDMLNYQSKKGANLYGFGYIPELLQVFGVYDPGILNQIHNMAWGCFNLSNYVIKDDVLHNRIYTTNPVKGGSGTYPFGMEGTQILDHIYTDQPTYDDNVDALAFKSIVYNSIVQDGSWTASGIYLPDHPVYDIKIYTTRNETPVRLPWNGVLANESLVDYHRIINALSAFKVKPLLYLCHNATHDKQEIIGNLNFFTTVEPSQLENMFNYYYLGLYDVEVKDVKEFQ